MDLTRYKSCGEYIVKLELLPDSITNESRAVYNKKYAKYRTNKVKVISVTHKITNEDIDGIKSDSNFHKLKYIVGSIVEESSFDKDLDATCSSGVHYYLTREAAYYHYLDYKKHKINIYKEWYPNGRLRKLIIGDNVTKYYESGEICSHNNKEYYKSGEIKSIEETVGEIPQHIIYFKDGGVKSIYVDYKYAVGYHENGELHYVAMYKNDAINGLVVYYDDEGKEYARWEY